jgi:transcriptional regulator with XRE-family HTH domain
MPTSSDPFYAEVGRRIRDQRDQRGLTQEALSSLVALSRTSVTNIERGRQKFLLHTLRDIANALQVPMASLLPIERASAPEPQIDDLLKDRSTEERNWIKSALTARALKD